MLNKILILLLLIITFSCSERFYCKRCPEKQDSTITIVKDTTIFVPVQTPKDSSMVKVLLKCDSLNNIYLYRIDSITGVKSKVKIVLKDNYLTAECVCDTATIMAKVKQQIIKTTHYKTKIQYKRTSFDHFTRWWFFISLAMFLALAYITFKKF